jgi:PA domain
MRKTLLLALLATIVATGSAFAGATITIQNNDAANLGFNDPTPATPVGGNPGTTLGEQRLNAFKFAANIWGNVLQSPVPIVIAATFSPINSTANPCTATSAILGQASAVGFISDFTNAPLAHVAYPIALANSLAGRDLNPGVADINAQFNALVDNPTCLGTTNWYYGLDGNHGIHIDLVSVLLHEFAHGLGFAGNIRTDGGTFSGGGVPSVFDIHTFDNQAGLRWDQMSSQQRLVSMVNTGHLAWDGSLTKAHAATLLKPITFLAVNSPSIIARGFDIGTASFGTAVDNITLTGDIVAATDAADFIGPSTTDGCSAYTNANAVAGKWALVDRGGNAAGEPPCTFVLKAQNAQAAGAIGIIIADNRQETCQPPGMSGSDGSITIPVVSISQNDGAAIRGQAANGVNATLRFDPTHLAGATAEGLPRLYAPCTLAPGSSIYHFDVSASPNLLMEPAISDDLNHGLDLTLDELRDIGWQISAPKGGRTILRRF